MADTKTRKETFPKKDGWTTQEIENERKLRELKTNVISCLQTEDEENFYLISLLRITKKQVSDSKK